MENNYKVYCHLFPNGKRYIGITLKKVKYRWNNGKGYKGQTKVYNAIQKYKWENIEHIILYDNLSKEEAETKEQELIKKYNTIKKGYNVAGGGNSFGKMTDEIKQKISKSVKGKNVGEKNGMYGKHPKGEFKKGNIPHNKGVSMSLQQKVKLGKKVKCVETNTIYYSMHNADEKTEVSFKMISACCNKKIKTAGGFHWEFVE